MKKPAGVAEKFISGSGLASLGPLDLLVLQATPFCNLNCSYCYLPDRDDRSKMSLAVVGKAVERVLEANLVVNEFTVVWHAGEPLVPGVDYYEQALRHITEIVPSKVRVHHSFQTNGVLIDERWCEFFEEHSVRLGLSIDGPAGLHDLHRQTRGGRGTHAKVMRAVDLLNERKIPFHVIAVLTDEALNYPDPMFNFFDRLDTEYLCFNIEEIEGENLHSSILANDRYRQYRDFLLRFYHRREQVRSGIRVREIDGAITSILTWRQGEGPPSLLPQENTPFKILNVDVNGGFSTFSPELLGTESDIYGDFRLGNLFDIGIKDSIDTDHYRAIWKAIEHGIRNCHDECKYFEFCGGGSPSNKFAESQRLDCTETAYCKLQKKACVDTAIEILERNLQIENQSSGI